MKSGTRSRTRRKISRPVDSRHCRSDSAFAQPSKVAEGIHITIRNRMLLAINATWPGNEPAARAIQPSYPLRAQRQTNRFTGALGQASENQFVRLAGAARSRAACQERISATSFSLVAGASPMARIGISRAMRSACFAARRLSFWVKSAC